LRSPDGTHEADGGLPSPGWAVVVDGGNELLFIGEGGNHLERRWWWSRAKGNESDFQFYMATDFEIFLKLNKLLSIWRQLLPKLGYSKCVALNSWAKRGG